MSGVQMITGGKLIKSLTEIKYQQIID